VLVHFADERTNFPIGELVHAVAEQAFVLLEGRQRGVHRFRVLHRHMSLHRAARCGRADK
jgi:hypothetical protein